MENNILHSYLNFTYQGKSCCNKNLKFPPKAETEEIFYVSLLDLENSMSLVLSASIWVSLNNLNSSFLVKHTQFQLIK